MFTPHTTYLPPLGLSAERVFFFDAIRRSLLKNSLLRTGRIGRNPPRRYKNSAIAREMNPLGVKVYKSSRAEELN